MALNDKDAVEIVNDRLSVARRGRDEYEERAIENEEFYHNYIDETSHPYLSNIALPWPYIIIESYLGKCIQMLAAQMPYVRVVEEDNKYRTNAKKVEKDSNMVLYRQKWPILAYNTYKQAFKYPCAFIYERPWGMLKGIEMPIFSLMNWFHTWVNPACLDFEDDDAYMIWETYVPMKSFDRFKTNKSYKNLDKMQIHQGEIYDESEKTIRSFKNLSEYPSDKHSKLVRLWTYWDHENFILITNENNPIRPDDNFLDGKIPCKKITPIPIENEFYGMSILDEGKDLFTECNENRNQYNDAVNLMLNPQWIVSRSCEIKRSMIQSRPGGLLFTDDVNGLQPMKVDWNILAQSIARNGLLSQDIMNYSNAFPQMRGQAVSGQETATEYMGMRQAGELRSQTYNLLLAMMSIEEMIEDVVIFKQMFMTEDSSFFYWPEQNTESVTVDDYRGIFSYKTFANFKQMVEIERKHYIEAMTLIFGGANGAFLPFVMPKADEWLDRLIDYFDLRNPDQLRLTNDELQQAQMMSRVQQMMGMIGGMRGGNAPLALGEKAMRMGPENEINSEMGTMIPEMMGR